MIISGKKALVCVETQWAGRDRNSLAVQLQIFPESGRLLTVIVADQKVFCQIILLPADAKSVVLFLYWCLNRKISLFGGW